MLGKCNVNEIDFGFEMPMKHHVRAMSWWSEGMCTYRLLVLEDSVMSPAYQDQGGELDGRFSRSLQLMITFMSSGSHVE